MIETSRKGIYNPNILVNSLKDKQCRNKIQLDNIFDLWKEDFLFWENTYIHFNMIPYLFEWMLLFSNIWEVCKDSSKDMTREKKYLNNIINLLWYIWKYQLEDDLNYSTWMSGWLINMSNMYIENDWHVHLRIMFILKHTEILKKYGYFEIVNNSITLITYLRLFLEVRFFTKEELEKSIKISNEEFNNILSFFWYIKYSDYQDLVKKRWIPYYFKFEDLEKYLKIPLQVHETPFVIHNIFNNEVFLLPIYKRDNLLMQKIKKNMWESKYGYFIEDYVNDYCKKTIKDNVYLYGKWEKYKKGSVEWEIDFYIYNKKTKNIIFIEIKAKNEMYVDMYKKDNIDDLTSEKNNQGRKWSIYEGIEQLYKISENKELIEKKLKIEINKTVYLFLTDKPCRHWNCVIREAIRKNNTKRDYIPFYFIYLFISIRRVWIVNWFMCKRMNRFL